MTMGLKWSSRRKTMAEKPNEQQLKTELLKLSPKEHLMVLNYIRT